MTRHHANWLVALAVAALAVLGACTDDDPDPTETTIPTQLANPASVYCVDQGGTLEIVEEDDGQVGFCTLPDGTRVEEWEYYRSQTGVTTTP